MTATSTPTPTPEDVKKKLKDLEELKRRAKKLTGKKTRQEQDDAHRADMRLRRRAATREGQCIAPIPPVKNWERRLACKFDLQLFFWTYLRHVFWKPFSSDHKSVIGKAQEAVLHGGLYACAMPRGSGKSEICKGTCLHAGLYGHRRFALLIGATSTAATDEMLEGIRFYLESPDLFPLLLEDFPEIVSPILALEGESHRQGGQRSPDGARTNIHWGGNKIDFPCIPPGNWIDGKTIGPPPGAGFRIRVTGITGRIRGFNIGGVRPDIVIPDDPQTDESAASVAGCEKRERILASAVIGLGGHGKKIAGIMPCTVIRAGDAIDNILDHAKHPEWDSSRTKLLYSFPTNMTLWEKYRDVRNNYDPYSGEADKKRAATEATLFYADNAEAMQAGTVVAWQERYDDDEFDALQFAMNKFFQDRHAFFAEYQNEPLAPDLGDVKTLGAEDIAKKLSGLARGIVPLDSVKLTCYVDVQATLLYWLVAAWRLDFTGYVVDYGSWPDQGRSYFALADATRTLEKATNVPGEEAQIRAGLVELTKELLAKQWAREGGGVATIDKCLIDSGYQAEIVYEFVRRSPFSLGGLMLPSKGRFYGATSRHGIAEGALKQGDLRGIEWILPAATLARGVKLFQYDTNHHKNHLFARLATPLGSPGSLSLFGSDPTAHRMLADHLTAEYRADESSKETGRSVLVWKQKFPRRDNHLLDCAAGALAAASLCGVSLPEHRPTTAKKKAYMSLDEMKAAARGKR